MTDLRKAAEMALEALRNAEIVKMEQLEAMYALQEALAQPEQKGHCTCGDPKALGVVHFRTRPCFHYTAPLKREWVGLMDEDLSVFTTEFYNGAVWAEAKLKEKNSG